MVYKLAEFARLNSKGLHVRRIYLPHKVGCPAIRKRGAVALRVIEVAVREDTVGGYGRYALHDRVHQARERYYLGACRSLADKVTGEANTDTTEVLSPSMCAALALRAALRHAPVLLDKIMVSNIAPHSGEREAALLVPLINERILKRRSIIRRVVNDYFIRHVDTRIRIITGLRFFRHIRVR